jgi:hypothetical protein
LDVCTKDAVLLLLAHWMRLLLTGTHRGYGNAMRSGAFKPPPGVTTG